MMTIWLAIIMACSNTRLSVDIKCDLSGSEEVWSSKESCEKEAGKGIKTPFRCIDVEVSMKGLPENVEVRLK